MDVCGFYSPSSGVAVQHDVLPRGHMALPGHPVHIGAFKDVSVLRAGEQDGEGSPAVLQRRNAKPRKLQWSHSGQLVPTEKDQNQLSCVLSRCDFLFFNYSKRIIIIKKSY